LTRVGITSAASAEERTDAPADHMWGRRAVAVAVVAAVAAVVESTEEGEGEGEEEEGEEGEGEGIISLS
jgi:hypothetical protein